jgi:SAM-dependent methyltransferase
VEVLEFVVRELPSPPARVLELGCGDGELAHALAAAGYTVLGIDPDAPEGPIFRRSAIEELDEPGPFDAVVASRSLHHVHDLAAGLDKVAALLRPGGVFVVDEFGWERLDAASAERVGIPLDEWQDEHEELHTAEAMRRELDERFTRRSLSAEPYLYRESRSLVSEEEERQLVEAGRIRPIGFRYVGVS